ncbi:hypothetical protein [Microbacterium jejuense]|uniref:hypothetical protein n=1 Tax=Microbacterium jejuense TaxID=1263637 RepID=UPI0031EFC9AC
MSPSPTDDELRREILIAERDKAVLEKQEVQDRVTAAAEAADAAKPAAPDPAAERKKQEEAARQAQIAGVDAASTAIANLKGASLTLPEKTVFRDALVSSAALQGAAGQVAAAIKKSAGISVVLITGRTDQTASLLAAATFAEAVEAFLASARKQLGEPHLRTIAMAAATDEAAATDAAGGSLVGAIVGLGVAAMNALTVDTTVDASSRTASETETHIAVIQALAKVRGVPPRVLHESMGIPPVDIALIRHFHELQDVLLRLDAKSSLYAEQIDGLDAKKNASRIATLQAKKADVDAVYKAASAFVETSATADATTGITPLTKAVLANLIVAASDDSPRYLAIVRPATLASHQIALKRRLFAPRLIVSAAATIELVVIDIRRRVIATAGTFTDEAVLQARFPMVWFGSDEELTPHYSVLKGTMEP